MSRVEKKVLTGIERQLVLEYLIDGNVPVTLCEYIEKTDETHPERQENASEKDNETSSKSVKKLSSGIFPVALKSEQIKVINQGIILLQNPPQLIKSFSGKKVKVQFYFNRLGLYFLTEVKNIRNGLALVIPENIFKVEDEIPKKNSDFSAVIYYDTGGKNGKMDVECILNESYSLFTQPKWSDVSEENQKEAKNYIEKAVLTSKSDGTSIGNGLFLISVSRFLSEKADEKVNSIDGRVEKPSIIYIDHERIVFASKASDMILKEDGEYALMLTFPLSSPVMSRKVYVTFRIAKILSSVDESRKCACAVFTSIKEEDERFLYEKMQ